MRVLSQENPSGGDVVLIKDNLPRRSWKPGRILNLKKRNNGYIRSAKGALASRNVWTCFIL